jgi:hypothetical protein
MKTGTAFPVKGECRRCGNCENCLKLGDLFILSISEEKNQTLFYHKTKILATLGPNPGGPTAF